MVEEFEKKVSKKQHRAHLVLIGLVELYIKTGKHIGSNTLRANGFEHLSPATIRNYFSELEQEGFLEQAHASGGRIPTEKALRLFAEESLANPIAPVELKEPKELPSELEGKKLSAYLSLAAETLSEMTGCATFLSSVRFDHDLIVDIRLLGLDNQRLLSVIVTDFGQIFTESLNIEKKLSAFTLKRLEGYLQWKVKGSTKPLAISRDEEKIAINIYNEIMVRYLVRYCNFSDEDLHKSGLSRLLSFPEFNEPVALTTALSLFEDTTSMRHLLRECDPEAIRFWIGKDLAQFGVQCTSCAVIACSFRIGHINAGSIGVLGPMRLDYPALFATLKSFSQTLTEVLTRTLYTHKLTFRQPRSGEIYLEQQERAMLEKRAQKLINLKPKQQEIE